MIGQVVWPSLTSHCCTSSPAPAAWPRGQQSSARSDPACVRPAPESRRSCATSKVSSAATSSSVKPSACACFDESHTLGLLRRIAPMPTEWLGRLIQQAAPLVVSSRYSPAASANADSSSVSTPLTPVLNCRIYNNSWANRFKENDMARLTEKSSLIAGITGRHRRVGVCVRAACPAGAWHWWLMGLAA